MSMKAGAAPAGGRGSNAGLAWIVGLIIVAIMVSKCSSTGSAPTATGIATTDPVIRSLNSSVAAQKPAPVEPLRGRDTATGFAEMRKAFGAEGLSGAMIFSQNCYDALAHGFTWRKLDICGAADLRAVASVPEDEVAGLEKELAYFQSETAAGRFLGAATGAGLTADDADRRLALMQSRATPEAKAAEKMVSPMTEQATDSFSEGMSLGSDPIPSNE